MQSDFTAPDLVVRWSGPDDPAAPTLLLFHGLTDSGECWADAMARWSGRYHVGGVDQLGHGESPRVTPEQLASADPMEEAYAAAEATVAGVAAERGPVVVIGHSMGGGMATALAARRPDLVRAAVLEDPAWLDPDDRVADEDVVAERIADCRGFATDAEAKLEAARREHPDWPEVEFAPWARSKAQTDVDFLALGVATVATPWEEMVAAIRVPTLVLTGEDRVILDEDKLARARAVGNPLVSVQVVPGAGHSVRRDRPGAFHALVDPWLEQHS
jgi:lipase